jgi:hypothetical protein
MKSLDEIKKQQRTSSERVWRRSLRARWKCRWLLYQGVAHHSPGVLRGNPSGAVTQQG